MLRLGEDLRYGVRSLWRARSFTALSVLSLALGIGANTTIFTLINAIFLRPLPVQSPESLVTVYTRDTRNPGNLPVSNPNYRDYRDHNLVFSSLALYASLGVSQTGMDEPQPLTVQLVSGSYFPTLGVQARLGRVFGVEEDRATDASPVAVISHSLWIRRFGAEHNVVGKTVEINGYPFTIVGVAPAEFHGVNVLVQAEVWVPAAMYRQVMPNPLWFEQRRALLFSVFGRLRPGASLHQAEAAMQGLATQLEQQYPQDNRGRTVVLAPLTESTISPNVRGNLMNAGAVLMTIAGLVLLVACANVANLLLARATGRSREIAIRVAMGASRWQVVRQLLTESTLLSLAGGGVGLLLARWTRDAIWLARPPMLNAVDFRVDLDWRVLSFTFGVAVATGFLFGLAPALRASKLDLVSDLKDRACLPAPRGSFNPLSMLVVGQVALSLVAVVGASLFVRSLQEAQRIDPGFQTEHLVLVQFNLAARGYNEARGRQFQRDVVAATAGLPGVTAASIAATAPFTGGFSRTVLVEGQDDMAGARGRLTLAAPVMPGYLRTMGITVVRGRDFAETDQPTSPRVAIVNDVMANRYWPGGEALGRRFRFFGETTDLEVVGIARTANYLALGEEPRPFAYISMLQTYSTLAVLHARVAGDEQAALASIKRELQRRDAKLLLDGDTMTAIIHNSLWAPRLAAGLLGTFGLLALLLTSVGIYGVISYGVTQRVREIGVRVALGATGMDVQRMIVVQAVRLVAMGVVIGCGLSLASVRMIKGLLYVVSSTDALTFIVVPAGLVVIAVLACWLPSRRATRIDPVAALRYQ